MASASKGPIQMGRGFGGHQWAAREECNDQAQRAWLHSDGSPGSVGHGQVVQGRGGFMLRHSQAEQIEMLHNIVDLLVPELQRRGRFRIVAAPDDPASLDVEWRHRDGAFHPDAEFENTKVETTVAEHVFRTRGKVLVVPGWRGVYGELSEEIGRAHV